MCDTFKCPLIHYEQYYLHKCRDTEHHHLGLRALESIPALNIQHVLPFSCSDETSGMDSDLEEDTEETGEPLAKREKSEHEVIQVIQVGALEDGSHPVVGVVQPGVLHSLPQPPQDHTEHILTPSAGTPTIRHCSATGNTYASV